MTVKWTTNNINSINSNISLLLRELLNSTKGNFNTKKAELITQLNSKSVKSQLEQRLLDILKSTEETSLFSTFDKMNELLKINYTDPEKSKSNASGIRRIFQQIKSETLPPPPPAPAAAPSANPEPSSASSHVAGANASGQTTPAEALSLSPNPQLANDGAGASLPPPPANNKQTLNVFKTHIEERVKNLILHKNTMIEQLQDEMNLLREEIEKNKVKIKGLEELKDNKQIDIDNLTERIDNLTTQLQQINRDSKNKNAATAAAAAALQTNKNKINAQAKKLQEDLERLLKEKTQVETQLAAIEAQLNAQIVKNNDLQVQLTTSTAEVEKLKVENERLKEQLIESHKATKKMSNNKNEYSRFVKNMMEKITNSLNNIIAKNVNPAVGAGTGSMPGGAKRKSAIKKKITASSTKKKTKTKSTVSSTKTKKITASSTKKKTKTKKKTTTSTKTKKKSTASSTKTKKKSASVKK